MKSKDDCQVLSVFAAVMTVSIIMTKNQLKCLLSYRTAVLQEPVSSRRKMSRISTDTLIQVHL